MSAPSRGSAAVPISPTTTIENSPRAISAVPARSCPCLSTPSRRAANAPVKILVIAVTAASPGAVGDLAGEAQGDQKRTDRRRDVDRLCERGPNEGNAEGAVNLFDDGSCKGMVGR